MTISRDTFVKTAATYIGCKESDGSFRPIIDLYNTHKPYARGVKMKYDMEWCACFVSAVAIQCQCTDIIPPEISCGYMIAGFKNLGEWEEDDSYTPNPGDIIFYDWDDKGAGGNNTGWPDHVGIVEKCAKNIITVIEGNYNEEVKRRTIPVNYRYIRGFGIPRFLKESAKSVEDIALEVVAGKWGNGAKRKKALTDAGYDYAAVQKRVNEILANTVSNDLNKEITSIAYEVIKGKWGNGAHRKAALTAAGYDYEAVQKMVNKILKG